MKKFQLPVQLREIHAMLLIAKQYSREGNEEGMLIYSNLAEEFLQQYLQQLKDYCERKQS